MTASAWKQTACILCECNCGIEVQVDGRRLAKIRGDKTHLVSEGYACEKAQRLDHYQSDTGRLTSPLRRRGDGSYEQIGWEVAIREIVERLAEIRNAHGGDKILFYGGGGQANHLGRAYGVALQAALGAKYYSNALAQEKTGEIWVDGRLYGGHTKGDFEHAEVVIFVGKNPWQSHSFPRARPVLKEIAEDPARTMIVIDPRRSETAAMADIHIQVRPGTDAWCLAAISAVLVQEDLIDHRFLADHATGVEPVLEVLAEVPVAEYAETCGVPEEVIREAARRFAGARSACTYEDLGVQQAPNSTLSSYLNKLLWILTGNFAKPGAMFRHSTFVSVTGGDPGSPPGTFAQVADRVGQTAIGALAPRMARLSGQLDDRLAAAAAKLIRPLVAQRTGAALQAASGGSGARRTPVTGARIIGGLVPCNSIPEEILTDHPDRFRAIWIDSSNPAHSLADSKRFRQAMDELEFSVVIDVAMTETARCADYVLPATSQYEKWEASFFNFEFPRNAFHLRAPLMDPLPGTLPEPEIYARLLRELGVVEESVLETLRRAARRGRTQFALAFFSAVGTNPALTRVASYLLYESLGPTLDNDAAGAAALWAVAHNCAMSNPEAVRRAGFDGAGFEPGEKLFDAILTGKGVVFTVDDYPDAWNYVRGADKRFTVAIPELLEKLRELGDAPSSWVSDEFPFVLTAGERRSYTANTIFRDPAWRKRDAGGALRINPADAERLGVETGACVRVITEAGDAQAVAEVTDMMYPGQVSLPNGLGVDHTDEGVTLGERVGVAPNELTSIHNRDWLAGTPLHKHVPARLELISTAAEATVSRDKTTAEAVNA